MLYEPGKMFSITKSPSIFADVPFSVPSNITDAPKRGNPVSSYTYPLNSPTAFWALLLLMPVSMSKPTIKYLNSFTLVIICS